MTLEEAIQTAIDYETKVRDTYRDAADRSKDPTGRRVFGVLAEEEEGHIGYLRKRLSEWKETGALVAEQLATVVPRTFVIDKSVKDVSQQLTRTDRATESELLSQALKVEVMTANFYRRMVDELGEMGKVFKGFLQIEEGHQAIIQAEMDYLNQSGSFFDFREFTMEH